MNPSRVVAVLYARFVAAAGGDPRVVLPLTRALRAASDGRVALLQERSRRRGILSSAAARALLFVLTGLGSVFLAVLMVHVDHHPPFGAAIIAGAHWFLGLGWLLGRAGPSLLADDDREVMGWWPLAPRDLLLARMGVLLWDLLPFTGLLAGAPLAVFLFTGRPPVAAALSFGAALVVQSLALALGCLVAMALVVRRFGRHRASRIAALLADGNGFMFIWILFMAAPRFMPWLRDHPLVLSLVPPFWTARWADPTLVGPFALHVVLLTAIAYALARLGPRLALAGGGPAAGGVEFRPSGSRRRHWTDVVELLMAPLARDREGWVTRRLFIAHLRSDWRFLGLTLAAPLVFAVMVFGFGINGRGDIEPGELDRTALMAVNLAFMVPFFAAQSIMGVMQSSTPAALWPVALADLDGWRLLQAQRSLARAIIAAPMVIVYGIEALHLGASWRVALLDAGLLICMWETAGLFIQGRMRTMSFALEISNRQDMQRMGTMFIGMGLGIVYVTLIIVYSLSPLAMAIVWAVTLAAMAFMRRRLRKLTEGTRLRMDLVPDT